MIIPNPTRSFFFFYPLRAGGQEGGSLAEFACVCLCGYVHVCMLAPLLVSAYCAPKHKKMISGIFCWLNSMPLRLRQLVKDVKDEMVLGSPCSDSTRRRKDRKENAFLAYSDPLLTSCDAFFYHSKDGSSRWLCVTVVQGLLKTNGQFSIIFSSKTQTFKKVRNYSLLIQACSLKKVYYLEKGL